MTTYLSIVVAVLAFSIIVVAHEAGHLISAKKNGIYVIEFALGMGPKLLSRKIGETDYSIRLLPIGGFCKMLGEDTDCDDPRAFGSKRPLARFIVLVSGAVMNFLLGIVLIFVTVLLNGYTTTIVENASPDQPAYQAGISPGDKIVSVNGRKTKVFEDILFVMNFSKGEDVVVVTEREGVQFSYNITPAGIAGERGGLPATRYIIGISAKSYAGVLGGSSHLQKATISDTVSNTFDQFGFYVRTTYEALKMLITGELGLKELSGVIGIGNTFVESIEEPINATNENGEKIDISIRLSAALSNVLFITTLITVNLGIMNLLPFPALDGGRAVFVLIEAVRKKPIDQNKEGAVHFAGFVMLMVLMVFVTYNDILRVFLNG